MFEQGLTLMVVGMATVFVFLTILVAATSAMSVLVMRWLPTAIESSPTAEEVAVITAAIAHHRRQQGLDT